MAKHDKPLDEMNMTELRDLASERDIPGRSSMHRAELIAALSEPAGDKTEPDAAEPGPGAAAEPDTEIFPEPGAAGSAAPVVEPPAPAAPTAPKAATEAAREKWNIPSDAKFSDSVVSGKPFPAAAAPPPPAPGNPDPAAKLGAGATAPPAPPSPHGDPDSASPLPVKRTASSGMRLARVTIPGTHVGTIDVEIPAALAGPEAVTAAIRAAKEKQGISAFGAQPVVELL
jgi:hypothetical protein